MVYGLDHNGDRGKVKGLKNRTIIPFAYDREFIMAGYGARNVRVLCVRVRC